MAYYDEDLGYVPDPDPREVHDKRRHEKDYHKSEVSTTKELVERLSYDYFLDESKEIRKRNESSEKQSFESNDMLSSFNEAFSNAFTDMEMATKLYLKDMIKNKDEVRIISTSKEHIIREGTETYIVYKNSLFEAEVLGVFFNKEDAVKFKELIKK